MCFKSRVAEMCCMCTLLRYSGVAPVLHYVAENGQHPGNKALPGPPLVNKMIFV
jgi:hypothetical protein